MYDLQAGRIDDPMFTSRTRTRECRHCKEPFEQRELSKTFTDYLAKMPESYQRAWKRAVPENALPLFCTTCERRDLGFDHRTPPAPITTSIIFENRPPRVPTRIGQPA